MLKVVAKNETRAENKNRHIFITFPPRFRQLGQAHKIPAPTDGMPMSALHHNLVDTRRPQALVPLYHLRRAYDPLSGAVPNSFECPGKEYVQSKQRAVCSRSPFTPQFCHTELSHGYGGGMRNCEESWSCYQTVVDTCLYKKVLHATWRCTVMDWQNAVCVLGLCVRKAPIGATATRVLSRYMRAHLKLFCHVEPP